MDDLRITPSLVVSGRALSWSAARASGPGGQNVNKVSSKVDMRFDVALSGLPHDVCARLIESAGHRVDSEGRIVIVSSRSRDQSLNLADARAKVAALVLKASLAPIQRRPTKPTRASKERRLSDKRERSLKKSRRNDIHS